MRNELAILTGLRTPEQNHALFLATLHELDLRIGQLQATRAVIATMAGVATEDTPSAPRARRGAKKSAKTTKKTRTRVVGSDAIVLDVIREGNDTIAKIADAAKLKPFTARTAVLRLEQLGKVRREGASRSLRYLAS